MFELIGLIHLYLFGYGWIWGKESNKALQNSGEDIYSNGSNLLIIGLFSIIMWAVIIAIIRNI